jgi:hypothetical protein
MPLGPHGPAPGPGFVTLAAWLLSAAALGAILGMALLFLGISRGTAEAVRRHRHRFANHVQVISGWLEVGRADRAQQYLDTLMAAQSSWLRRLPSWYQVWIWVLDSQAEAAGVPLTWQVADDVSLVAAVRLALVVRGLVRFLRRAGGGTLEVSGQAGGFRVTVGCPGATDWPPWVAGVRSLPDPHGVTFVWPALPKPSGTAVSG